MFNKTQNEKKEPNNDAPLARVASVSDLSVNAFDIHDLVLTPGCDISNENYEIDVKSDMSDDIDIIEYLAQELNENVNDYDGDIEESIDVYPQIRKDGKNPYADVQLAVLEYTKTTDDIKNGNRNDKTLVDIVNIPMKLPKFQMKQSRDELDNKTHELDQDIAMEIVKSMSTSSPTVN